MKDANAYRVDFKYVLEEQASLYIVAETPELAAEGAKIMLGKSGQQYASPEITKVEEYNPVEPTNPTLN